MTQSTRYDLQSFVAQVRDVVARGGKASAQGKAVAALLPKLLKSRDWLDKAVKLPEEAAATTANIAYMDPDYGFVVLVHTHAPGMKSPVHDHGPNWVVYGVYKNEMRHNRFQRTDDGSKEGYAEIRWLEPVTLREGDAAYYHPGFGHQIVNETTRRSISIRVTSGDMRQYPGRVYDPEKGTVSTPPPGTHS